MSNLHMKLGPGFFSLTGHFEKGPNGGPALTSYLCPAGVPTIGLGSIRRLDGSPVELGDTITMEEVFLLAERDAEDAANAVRKIQRPLTQNQFEAYTAFTHNLGEGNFRKIAPLIEEGRWEDVAEKMGEYVRAWGRYEGRWYYMALLGLKIRRTAEGLHSLGLPWQEVCDPDNIGMPKRREWQPEGTARDGTKGRYFDVLLPGATEFTAIEAMASALRPTELVLTTKAEPAPSVAQGKAGQPATDPQPQKPAAPAPTKPAAPASPSVAAGPAPPPKPPQGSVVAPVPSTKTPPPMGDVKPPSPYSVPITDAPYRVDPNFGLKPMETTDRWKASVAQNSGMVMMRLARYGFMGAGPATVATYIEKDPIFSGAFIALVGVIAVGGYGYVRKCYGDWMRHHGERRASQAMV